MVAIFEQIRVLVYCFGASVFTLIAMFGYVLVKDCRNFPLK